MKEEEGGSQETLQIPGQGGFRRPGAQLPTTSRDGNTHASWPLKNNTASV